MRRQRGGRWLKTASSSGAALVVPVVGIPLITETALRYQWAAAPLPLAHLAAMAAARRLAHKPVQPTNLANQVLALLFGLGLRRVERAGAERLRAGFEAERRAAEATAVIAGQYLVARSTYLVNGSRSTPTTCCRASACTSPPPGNTPAPSTSSRGAAERVPSKLSPPSRPCSSRRRS